MIQDAVPFLACAACGRDLALRESSLVCSERHSFDIARQGYVSLLGGGGQPRHIETAAMVEARDAFLESGAFGFIAEAVSSAVEQALVPGSGGCALEIGAGTGYYLARLLDALPSTIGIAADISKYAARRSARAHPRMASVVCDVWRSIPLRTNSAIAVIDVFAPRNAEEVHRVLRPDGVFVVITPTPRHMAAVVGPLGLLRVDADKEARLEEQLGSRFRVDSPVVVESELELDRSMVARFVRMGPSAWHADPTTLDARLAMLPEKVRTAASVELRVCRPL